MTIREAIAAADLQRPNSIAEDVKLGWINELEGIVQTRILLLSADALTAYVLDVSYSGTITVPDSATVVLASASGFRTGDVVRITATGNNGVSAGLLDVSSDGLTLSFAAGSFTAAAETAGTATADRRDTELIVPAPYDRVYESYLMQRIDLALGDSDRFNNDRVWHNAVWDEFAKWYNRTHLPGTAETRGFFLTAYGLAVKHGFVGTEDDWLASLEGDIGPGTEMRYADGLLQWRPVGGDSWTTVLTLAQLQGSVVSDTLTAAQAARTAAETARDGAAAAKTAAETARAGAESAQTGAQAAQTAAEAARDAAASSRTASESAKTAAETAASAAAARSGDASSSAAAAQASAAAASASAQAAAGSASSASAGASSASTKAGEASASAQAAAASQADALASKNAAASSASAAQSSAAAADTAKNDAQTAKTDAVTAKTAAETASGTATAKATEAGNSAAAAAGSASSAAKSASDAAISAQQAAAGQVNSDWNVTDATNKAYILNKPDLLLKADKKIPSAAGNLATLDANGNLADGGKAVAALEPFVITATRGTPTDGVYEITHDKTLAEIYAAYQANKRVIVSLTCGGAQTMYELSFVPESTFFIFSAWFAPTVSMAVGAWLQINQDYGGWMAYQYPILDSGGIMNGDLTLAADPTAALGAATKQYVDAGDAAKLGTSGDGSNVTATFTQATSRANIATGEKLSVILGKIMKWFSDLGSLAFKSVAIKSDLDSSVQTSLGKADTALQGATLSLTLAVASWSNLSQTVTASGVTASNTVILGPSPDTQAAWQSSGTKCSSQGANTLTFTCATVPSAAITVNVLVLG